MLCCYCHSIAVVINCGSVCRATKSPHFVTRVLGVTETCAYRVACCHLASLFEYTQDGTDRQIDRHQTDHLPLSTRRGQRNIQPL